MKRSEIVFGLLRIPADIVSGFAALLLAYELRAASIDLLPSLQLLASPATLPPQNYYFFHFVLPAAAAFIVILAFFQLYALKLTLGAWREIARVGSATLLWLATVIAWFFLVEKQLFFSRALLLQATIFLGLFTVAGRMTILLVQRWCLSRGMGVRRVMSCGTVHLSPVVATSLQRDRRFRYIGHALVRSGVQAEQQKNPLDLVLQTDPNPASGETALLIDYCRSHHIGYAFLPPVFADVPHQLAIDKLGLTPMLRFEPTPLDGWGRVLKRCIDVVLGTIFLLILSPLLLLVAALVIVTAGWPIFYVSRRVGQYGRQSIPLLKFRTMCRDADERKPELVAKNHRADGPLFKIKNDPRVTPLGRVLRRFSIDELPQLINVLVGHLSLVGPRPHLPDEVARFSEAERRVSTVRPGITGLAQISGRSDLPFAEEVQLDMRYIEDWSLALDAWILWRTFFVVLFGRGAD